MRPWEIDPHSPIALLDNWLEERAFPPRKRIQMNSTWGITNQDAPLIQILRPHGEEWLFSFEPRIVGPQHKIEDPLEIRLWGPGMIMQGMVADFHLADPTSFDRVTSTISAWRKTKHFLYKEVWRYVNVLEHRSNVHPSTNFEHWIVAMSAEFFKFHTCKEDYVRMKGVLESAGIELNPSENP